jgi:putative ABC transport system substrate-binding protein
MAERKVAAILYGASLFYQVIRHKLVALAARYKIPAVYEWREFATAGGLMSYSLSRKEIGGQMGAYAALILKGVTPARLPVVQATRFEFVLNLRTANALGIVVPSTLLAYADEVIE